MDTTQNENGSNTLLTHVLLTMNLAVEIRILRQSLLTIQFSARKSYTNFEMVPDDSTV